MTVDGHESIMQTNAASHLLLTCLLMPLLRASASARIVWQTSGGRFYAAQEHVKVKIHDLDGVSTGHAFNAFHQCAFTAPKQVFRPKTDLRGVWQMR